MEQQRKRIVIADDEALRRDLREMLTNLGYLVVGDVVMAAVQSTWRG